MAQHVIPAAQLVPQYKPIGRCNNYADGEVPDTEDTIKFLLDTEQFIYTVDMFRDTLNLPVETPENPFVAPTNIHTIEAFMNRVGYQGVVDKTKINILQLFHVVINQTHVDYAALLWWDFINNVFQKKEAIQYPRFTKLIIADLIKKFPNIPKRIEEDYHSIKDDVPLVSVYTTGNVSVRGMLIPDALLTAEVRETDDFKESPTVSANPLETKKRKQTAGESSLLRKSLKITIKQRQIVENDDVDSEDMIEPRSQKENPEFVNDDDDKTEEKQNDDMCSLEIRNEETQTTIPTPPSSPRKILSWDKKIDQELMDIVSIPTISNKYSHLPGALHRMCRRQGYMIQDMERKCVT
ncbi:hypothetical protein Tco_0476331, partial [Tanacetum coccineum]